MSQSSTPDPQVQANEAVAFSSRWRQVKSCARCHRLRQKCIYDDPTYTSCRRCFAIGVECSLVKDPTLLNPRKKHNRKPKAEKDHLASLQSNIKDLFEAYNVDADTGVESGKVARLLKSENIEKLYDIQTQLTELQQFIMHVIDSSKAKSQLSLSSSSINSMKEGPVKLIPRYPSIPYQLNVMRELLKLKLVSKRDVETRFHIFVQDMLSFWPNISFPNDYLDFNYLLENRPLILLACISVTALNEPNLHDLLLYYLERNLAQRVCITGDISVDLIYAYTILSLWASPPKKWGSFKHQMNLLMALNLSLCLDSPNTRFRSSEKVLYSNSEERKLIRCHLSVYACCGCLGLSLPKFKCVSWNKNIAGCCEILLMGETSRADRFLSYYSRLIGVGQEINDYFTVEDDNKMSQLNLGDKIAGYEKRLQKLMTDSELFTSGSKERHLLSIIYYQLIMTMHDYVVCDVVKGHSTIISEVYLNSLSRLIRSCEKVVDSFVNLCDETVNFPTFFYYRPMHALVALIRARMLVVHEKLDIDINVQREYDRVRDCLEIISDRSLVAKKMSAILTRVERWMQISTTFNNDGVSTSMEALLGELGDEKVGVENLSAPNVDAVPVPVPVAAQAAAQVPVPVPVPQHADRHDSENIAANNDALQGFFNEIDADFLNIQFIDSSVMVNPVDGGDASLANFQEINSDFFAALKSENDAHSGTDFGSMISGDNLSDLLDMDGLQHNLEATGQISRNNSME